MTSTGLRTINFNGGLLQPSADSTNFIGAKVLSVVSTGGAKINPNAHTITIDITAVNDPPVSAEHTVTDALEDHSYAFTTSDFPFTDPQDTCGGLPANNFAGVVIGTIPARRADCRFR